MNNPEDDNENFQKEDEFEKRIKKLKELKENKEISQKRPKLKTLNSNEESDKKELDKLKKLNNFISNFFKTNVENDEDKKKVGIIIISLILFVLVFSSYYFLIYEPYQEELNIAKTSKLNELNSLYKGPLVMAGDVFTLENKIENSNKIEEVENIDVLRPATKSWKSYQLKSIKTNTDSFNRTMAIISTNETKNIIMNSANATKFVNENDATVLSNVKFEKPNTVAVPVLINRLQASGGLITIGSIVDIYVSSPNNISNQSTNNGTNPNISGSTVLAILRCEESGSIEADYIKSQTTISGNTTNPNENIESFSTNVEEMLKGAIAGGYDEESTSNLLNKYGLRLSNLEREANLADLESEYILLIEIPQDKVQYILQNMESIILTIPTHHAPDWMVDELYDTYN